MKQIKKIFFLYVILNPMIIFSQIPANDQNWNTTPFFSDDFTGIRSWNNNRVDNTGKWIAYFSESGITHGSNEHQIYQRENALFNAPSAGFLTLRATYSPNTTNYWYPGPPYPPVTGAWDYISGAIETTQQFKYGYFEIRAKLPPPNYGNFPAFWLWSYPNRYHEIDVFEQTIASDNPNGYKRVFGTYYWSEAGSVKGKQVANYILSNNEPPLTEFHTYAVEWSPKIIIWYFDGKPYGSALYEAEVPYQPMVLKVNYAIDNWKNNALHNTSLFPLDMVIDYVKVHKLNCDCNLTVSITNNTQLNTYSKSVKKKITVGTSSGIITVPSSGITLRATDEIIINSNFEVPLGSEFNAIVHECPE